MAVHTALALDSGDIMSEFYNCKLLSIDAWRDECGWYWNDFHTLESGIIIAHDSDIIKSPRKLLRYMRDNLGCLSEYSKGRVSVDFNHGMIDGVLITVHNKSTGEPLFALSSIH